MYALDFRRPILVVSENGEFHKQIENIAETVFEKESFGVLV